MSISRNEAAPADHTMEQRLFRYIWSRTKREQLWILAVIIASMPATFVLLDLPKYIINGPIQGKGFEKEGAVQRYFHLQFDVPDWLPFHGHYDLFQGFELERMSALYVLSGVFLLLVIVSGLFKFYINTFKGQLGERMLQLFRFELFERVLHFPLGEFRRVKPAEIATMIKDEVEPMGGFIGDAFVQPVFLGGQIITALAFIVLQNMLLGMIALALVAVQGIIIPRLRRRQLELGRQRQLTARALAGRIGEIVEDMPNVIINDTFAYQKWDVSAQLNKIFIIRYALYRWKFFVKFLNNMIAQFTPFLFYTVGGYLAIKGTLDIGQLVAVISAYKDLPGPVKELIDWDQERMDVEIKYQQVIEQFTMSGHVEIIEHSHAKDDTADMNGEIVISNLSVTDSAGSRIIQGLSLTLRMDEHVAVIGPHGSGGDALVETIARLMPISAGHIHLGGRNLDEWPHAVTGRRVSYVGPDTFFQQSTIQDALLYGLRHAGDAPDEATTASKREARRIARQNAFHIDPDKDWIDYAALRIKGPEDLPACLAEATKIVDFDDEIVGFGVNERFVDEPAPEEIDKLLHARMLLKERLAGNKKKKLVEPFDRAAYSHQATIAENILFGTPISDDFKFPVLAANETVRKALAAHQLDEILFETGKDIARTLVDLFADISGDDTMFRDVQLISPAQLPNYRLALKRVAKADFRHAAEADRVRFLDVAFGYVEPRDRLGALDDELRAKVVKVREEMIAALGQEQSDVAIYNPDVFSLQATVLDNLLFGRVVYGVADADTRVNQMVADVLEELNLHQFMFKIGLSFNIGNGGKRLNSGQRQKLALARAILRRPRVLVASRALSSLDSQSQTAILNNLLDRACPSNGEDGFGIIWSLADPRFANRFERVLTMEHGVLVSDTLSEAADGNKTPSERLKKSTDGDFIEDAKVDEQVEAKVA
ncbi:MAG: ATP-binding cassette domain-containing protein [Beijerinckiaceae bacterium]|nr:ATP-binding cassette domain-containing protein [Beijerinckiaceae bacterium]